MWLPEDLVALSRRPAVCFVATTMPSGAPQLTQTWVDTDGEHVVLNIVQGMQKARNLQRNPRVAMPRAAQTRSRRCLQVHGRLVRLVRRPRPSPAPRQD
jgi:hypothetical protein